MENSEPPVNSQAEVVQPDEQSPVGVRGWLLLFCITLFLRAAVSLVSGLNAVYSASSAVVTEGLMYVALGVLCLIAGVQICRKRKSAIRWAIVSMILALVYAVLMIMGGGGTTGLRYLFQSLVYMGIWWTYLVESKRVKATLVL